MDSSEHYTHREAKFRDVCCTSLSDTCEVQAQFE